RSTRGYGLPAEARYVVRPMIWAPGMVLNQTLAGGPNAEFQSTSGTLTFGAVPPGGVTIWIAVEPGSTPGADGQRKMLMVPSEPYWLGGRGMVNVLVVGGRLSGSRNQAKKALGPLAVEPCGAGRNENSLYWLSCSMYGSNWTRAPTPWTSKPGGKNLWAS